MKMFTVKQQKSIDAFRSFVGKKYFTRSTFCKIPQLLLPHKFYFCSKKNNSDHNKIYNLENWFFRHVDKTAKDLLANKDVVVDLPFVPVTTIVLILGLKR